jgi:hypothetical protein
MRLTIAQSGFCLALYLGILVLLPGPAQAAINDHRSPDGTCQGTPEPPTPTGTGCEKKICTNDGDWMCCNLCTIKGGYCCEQMVSTSVRPPRSGIRAPGGKLQVSPGTSTLDTSKAPKTGTTTAPIMRRGVEGEAATSDQPKQEGK